MQPTANSAALIVNSAVVQVRARRLIAGVRLRRVE
jgi:hypothetical protein